MFLRLVPARRRRRADSARIIALVGILTIAIALAFGSLHSGGTATEGPVAYGGVHATADISDAAHGCPGCGDHDEGAMAACLMVLVVTVLIAASRKAPRSWQTRIPPRAYQWVPQVVERPSTPRLELLCISRT